MLHEHALNTAEATANGNGSVDFSGTWKNQMDSTMTLQVSGADVTGTYTSKTSGSGGTDITGPIKGFTSGDLISFLVQWPGGSMTAWTGQLTGEGESAKLRTLWQLVTEVPDDNERGYFWQSTLAGADEFTRLL